MYVHKKQYTVRQFKILIEPSADKRNIQIPIRFSDLLKHNLSTVN